MTADETGALWPGAAGVGSGRNNTNDRCIRLALIEPEIAGNVGAVIRLAACLGTPLDIAEPCGFQFDDRKLKRAGLDYHDMAEVRRHADWAAFAAAFAGRRLVAMTTRGSVSVFDAVFQPGDILMMGSESRGLADGPRAAAALAVRIPLRLGARSLNLSVAAGIALAEALRQTGGLPVHADEE